MPFSLGRFLDPIGIIPGVGKGKGSIANGWDPAGTFTKDANGNSTSSAMPSYPANRDLGSELQGILSQLPQFSTQGPASLNTTLFGTDGGDGGLMSILSRLQPGVDQLNQASATSQRTGDLADAQALSGGYDTLKRQMNPELYGLMQQLMNPSALESQAGDYARGNLGPSTGEGYLSKLTGDLSNPDQLESGLYDQATRLMGTGGDLTAQELYQIEQDTRGANAGRGLYDSNSALGAEILGKDSARRQRMLDNANFASSVSQLRTNRINTAGGLASSLSGAQLQRQQQGLSGLLAVDSQAQGRMGMAAGIGSQLYSNPYDSLGRAPVNQSTLSSVLGQTPDYLSGLLSYGSDLYNTNYNAQASSANAAANNSAAKSSATTAAVGGVAGAGLVALAIF